MQTESMKANCPRCSSVNTVTTGHVGSHLFHFCLDCGKGFERRVEQAEAQDKPRPT